MNENLQKGLKTSPNVKCRSLSPMFCYEVMQNTARELQLETHYCFGPYKQRIAMLAKEKSCPVLTRKSDMFFMDLQHGIVYYHCLRWCLRLNSKIRLIYVTVLIWGMFLIRKLIIQITAMLVWVLISTKLTLFSPLFPVLQKTSWCFLWLFTVRNMPTDIRFFSH